MFIVILYLFILFLFYNKNNNSLCKLCGLMLIGVLLDGYKKLQFLVLIEFFVLFVYINKFIGLNNYRVEFF